MYICHPTYGEWAVEQAKPKMWKLKCFKFFLMRLADLDRVLQREESLEQVNITRVEMCEGFMEEMAAEEQQVVEECRKVGKHECRKVGKQGIRWADMEESQIEIDEKKRFEGSLEDSGTSVEKWMSYDMAVEEHEAVMQRKEEMMEAGLAEMNRHKTRDLVQEKDREFKRKEWDWENVIEDGSTREAFEPRGSEGFVCRKDGERKTGKGGRDEREKSGKERHEEGGKERHEEGGKEGQDKGEEGKEASRWQADRHERHEGGNEVIWRQDDGQDEGGKGFRWQDDDDDKKQVEKQEDVVRRQLEGDITDVWKNDEDEKRGEMGKGGQRVNLEDFLRRYKQAHGEQQRDESWEQRQGGTDESWEQWKVGRKESWEKDGGYCEQRQEMDQNESEKRRGIGYGKGMRKGQGKGKGEIDEQKDWEERWRVKKENWMNAQWGRMSEDDLGMGQTGERLRQEQWETVRTMKLKNEVLRMAECLGEEMASELGRGSWRDVRNLRREREGETGKVKVRQGRVEMIRLMRRFGG